MPVTTKGKAKVEVATGKVVAHSKSKSKAKAAARIRNMAHAAKEGDPKAKKGMAELHRWEESNPDNKLRI